jgi:hypothetical protein
MVGQIYAMGNTRKRPIAAHVTADAPTKPVLIITGEPAQRAAGWYCHQMDGNHHVLHASSKEVYRTVHKKSKRRSKSYYLFFSPLQAS